MEWLQHRWEKITDKGIRFYEVHLQQDLWDGWVLTRVWGRRGSELGRVLDQHCESYKDGIEKLDNVSKRREQRGYVLLNRH